MYKISVIHWCLYVYNWCPIVLVLFVSSLARISSCKIKFFLGRVRVSLSPCLCLCLPVCLSSTPLPPPSPPRLFSRPYITDHHGWVGGKTRPPPHPPPSLFLSPVALDSRILSATYTRRLEVILFVFCADSRKRQSRKKTDLKHMEGCQTHELHDYNLKTTIAC